MEPPSLDLWPKVNWVPDTQKSQRVNLDTLTPAKVASWKPGQTLLLNGKMLTGRDAAHKRIQDMLAKGEKLPVDFTNRVIYYVGPVDPVRDEVVGFADLGMEAIYEFDVKDMPVTVAVDASGTSVHQTGPKEWQARIGKIPVTVA
jgi:tartrate dehydratase beta subunit/fumarate hydratase class I family protein